MKKISKTFKRKIRFLSAVPFHKAEIEKRKKINSNFLLSFKIQQFYSNFKKYGSIYKYVVFFKYRYKVQFSPLIFFAVIQKWRGTFRFMFSF